MATSQNINKSWKKDGIIGASEKNKTNDDFLLFCQYLNRLGCWYNLSSSILGLKTFLLLGKTLNRFARVC